MKLYAILCLGVLCAMGARAQYDCFGVPAGSDTYDACGVCGGTDLVPRLDPCGVCLGNSSCCNNTGVAVYDPTYPSYCCDCDNQTCGVGCMGIVFLDLNITEFVCHMQDGTDDEFIILGKYIDHTGAINTSCTVMEANCQGQPGGGLFLYTDEVCNGIDDNCDGTIDVNTTGSGGHQLCDHAGICQWGLVDCGGFSGLYCEPRINQPALVTGVCVNSTTTGCHEFKNDTCDACAVEYDDMDQRMAYHTTIAMRYLPNYASVRVFPSAVCSHAYFKLNLDGIFETNDETVSEYMTGVFASDYLLQDVEVGHSYTNVWAKTSTETTLTSTTTTSNGHLTVMHVLQKEQKQYGVGTRNFTVPEDYVKSAYTLTNWSVVHLSHFLLLRLRVYHRAGVLLSPAPKADLSEIYFLDGNIQATWYTQPDYEDTAGQAQNVILYLRRTAPTITTLFVFMPVENVAGLQTFVYDPHMVLRWVPEEAATATSAPPAAAEAKPLPWWAILLIVLASVVVFFGCVGLIIGMTTGAGSGRAMARRQSGRAAAYEIVSEDDADDDGQLAPVTASASLFRARRTLQDEGNELKEI